MYFVTLAAVTAAVAAASLASITWGTVDIFAGLKLRLLMILQLL